MKSLLVVVLVVVASCTARPNTQVDEMIKRNDEIVAVCMDRYDTKGHHMEDLYKEIDDTGRASRDFGCLHTCWLHESEWVDNDRNFNKEFALEYLHGLFGYAHIVDMMFKDMEECLDLSKGIPGECEFGVEFASCMYPRIKNDLEVTHETIELHSLIVTTA